MGGDKIQLYKRAHYKRANLAINGPYKSANFGINGPYESAKEVHYKSAKNLPVFLICFE